MSAPDRFPPGVLWSLWDMLKESADDFLELGRRMYDAEAICQIEENVTKGELDRPALTEVGRDAVKGKLAGLLAVARRLNLSVSMKLLGRRLGYDDLPKTEYEFRVLTEVLQDEIATTLFVLIPSHRAVWFNKDDMLSPAARTAFPIATNELRQAGNAFAADLPTACVFHCMRALEHGLRALAVEVGLVFDVQQWGTIIGQIDTAIDVIQQNGIPGMSKADKDAHLLFLTQAATQFSYFKDGWRNYVSHGRPPYNEQQALTVMSHVLDFMEGLATKLKE